MTGKADLSAQAAELRRQAQARLNERKRGAGQPHTGETDLQHLLHELEVHQVELEMMNEELLQSRAEVEAGLRTYVDLYDFAPVGYFTLARDGTIRNVNLAGAKFLGTERGALINTRFGVFVSVESRSAFNGFIERVFGSLEKETFEIALRKDTPSSLWVQIEAITAGEQHEICHAVVVDITKRKNAEETVRLAHERLRRFIDSNIVGIIIATSDGKIVEANDYYLSMIGFTRKEFEQNMIDWRAITPSEWLPADENALRELKDKGVCTPYEKEYERRDGTRISVFLTDTLLPGPDEQIAAFALDITERRQAENEVRESENKLREVQKMAHLGSWHWDVKTGNVEWSEEVYNLFRLDPKTFTPNINSILELSPWPEERQRDKDLINRVIESHAQGFYEQRFLRPDKSVGYYYSTFQGNYDEQGELVSIVGTAMDITERKEAEDKIRRLNEDLEQRIDERTAELRKTIAQLEETNRVFVDRELRMMELKARIAELEKKK